MIVFRADVQTHCGMGSLTEAIVSETPIIAVPFTSDGPALAAHCEC